MYGKVQSVKYSKRTLNLDVWKGTVKESKWSLKLDVWKGTVSERE